MKTLASSSRLQILALLPLAALAALSLVWGAGWAALLDSADLGRRIKEMALFRQGLDPYTYPDATYPPSAWFVFKALIPPWSETSVRALWSVLNLIALAALLEGLRLWIQASRRSREDGASAELVERGPEGASSSLFWGRLSSHRLWVVAVLLALAASKPVRAGFAMGQFHLIPTALVVWAVWLLNAGKPKSAGLLMGLALTKPTMVLPVVVLWLIQGQMSAVATAGLAQAGLWLATSAWLSKSPVTLFREWLHNARLQETAGMIDLPSVLGRAGMDGLVPPNVISLLVLVAGSVLFYRLRKVDPMGLAGLALVVSDMFVYHRHYDLVLLLPALAWLASRETPSWRSWFAAVLALFLIVPIHIGPLLDMSIIYDIVLVTLCYIFALALVLELNAELVSTSRSS